MIIDLLKESVIKYGCKNAVCCDDKEITFKELYEEIIQLSYLLKANGVRKGDHVALLMMNSIEFIKAFFAVNQCGGGVIPIYVNTGINKITGIINFYDIKFIISSDEYNNIDFSAINKSCDNLQNIFCFDSTGCVQCLAVKNLASEEGLVSEGYNDGVDLAMILFSSGTTGIPKGVMLSNKNIASNVKAISDYLKLTSNDRVLLIKNINHASSITGEMLVSLYNGCTLVLTKDLPTPSVILKLMLKKEITVFFAVPSILFTLVRYRDFKGTDIGKLRIINFYGANIGYQEIKSLNEKLPWVNLIYSYGLTEASPRVTFILKDDLLKKQESSGKPIDGVEIFIADEDGNFEKHDKIGEIVVKGPNVMMGYYKNGDLTERVLRNGFLYTGDIGYMDKDGFLYVVGRRDNLIIQSGKNVHPEEIESVLCGYKGVAEALVRGEEDDFLGQKIVAYVVPMEKDKLDLKEVLTYCRLNLEDYKIPREIHILDKLEKNQNGKIIRHSGGIRK